MADSVFMNDDDSRTTLADAALVTAATAPEAIHAAARTTVGEAATVSAIAAKGLSKYAEESGTAWIGVGFAAGLMALLSQWDYEHEKKRLRERYENEIGARLGKSPELVTNDDLDKVAQENPVLHEALRRNRWKRNLSIAITTVGAFASWGLSMWLEPIISAALEPTITAIAIPAMAAPLIPLLITVAVTFLSFMAMEHIFKAVGEKQLNLKEPPIQAAERDPSLQSSLSVPSQIHYLERLQSRKIKLSQEQVLTTFIAANPPLAAGIEARYGAKFADLAPAQRAQVIQDIGPGYGIAQLTADLNNHRVRAQELAFAVQGQASGVPKLASARLAEHDEVKYKLSKAERTIGELRAKLNAQAAQMAARAKEGAHHAAGKLGFRHSQVSGIPLENQPETQQSRPPDATTQPIGKWASQIISERQQQATQAAAMGV